MSHIYTICFCFIIINFIEGMKSIVLCIYRIHKTILRKKLSGLIVFKGL